MTARGLRPLDALKTYRYLRAGMIGAVILLAASIVIEVAKAGCLQDSISAYYYTPVRAIFVGSMFVVGLSLIVYKGRGSKEDLFLNLAGMLAPVVAVAPTIDVGKCYSLDPIPLPTNGDVLADWVLKNINNNFYALLIAGAVGLIAAFIIWLKTRRSPEGAAEIERGTIGLMVFTAGLLLLGWFLIAKWDNFYTKAHGYAAVAMFGLLAVAILANAWEQRGTRGTALTKTYTAIAVLMGVGAFIPSSKMFGEHAIFWQEAYEITVFLIYWIIQTIENWHEEVVTPGAPAAAPL